MFKFSAVYQIWKKYIQKLNDWDLPLRPNVVFYFVLNIFELRSRCSIFSFSFFTFPTAKKLKRFQKYFYQLECFDQIGVFLYLKMVCSYLPMPGFDYLHLKIIIDK